MKEEEPSVYENILRGEEREKKKKKQTDVSMYFPKENVNTWDSCSPNAFHAQISILTEENQILLSY